MNNAANTTLGPFWSSTGPALNQGGRLHTAEGTTFGELTAWDAATGEFTFTEFGTRRELQGTCLR